MQVLYQAELRPDDAVIIIQKNMKLKCFLFNDIQKTAVRRFLRIVFSLHKRRHQYRRRQNNITCIRMMVVMVVRMMRPTIVRMMRNMRGTVRLYMHNMVIRLHMMMWHRNRRAARHSNECNRRQYRYKMFFHFLLLWFEIII